MKKLLSTLLLLVAVSAAAWAAKATGTPFAVEQPDGTTLMVRLLGDEHFNWYQTMDNVLLVRVDGAFYVAKTEDDGTITSSGIIAHNSDSRNAEETSMAKSQDAGKFFKAASGTHNGMAKASGYPVTGRCPHMGKVKIPVIMMEYPDRPFSMDRDSLYREFDDYFNSMAPTPTNKNTRGYSSIKRYFHHASNGQFELEFDLYGPYMADYPINHYAYTKEERSTPSYALKQEALDKASADIDFTQYDSNNDGEVDMVYILYAGYGHNIGDHPESIWPHCSWGCNKYAQGMKINIIGMSNELVQISETKSIRAGIGVFCHEMSHGFGMPDLYWTLSDIPKDSHGLPDYNNCGPELWDLMDGGELINAGICPVQYTAWEREAMGWMEFEELNSAKRVTVYPLDDEQGRGKAYVVKNPENTNEYYVIENYTPPSPTHWNYALWYNYLGYSYKTPGLIVTHVNGWNGSANTMSPNNTYGKPSITILPADDFILADYSVGKECWYEGQKQKITSDMYKKDLAFDPYPGLAEATEIKSYKNYYGEDMGLIYPITDITVNDDRSISFTFIEDDIATGINDVRKKIDDANIYSIDGRCLGNDASLLPHGIYIRNGRKVMQ